MKTLKSMQAIYEAHIKDGREGIERCEEKIYLCKRRFMWRIISLTAIGITVAFLLPSPHNYAALLTLIPIFLVSEKCTEDIRFYRQLQASWKESVIDNSMKAIQDINELAKHEDHQ